MSARLISSARGPLGLFAVLFVLLSLSCYVTAETPAADAKLAAGALTLEEVSFSPPTLEHPFYHIRAHVDAAGDDPIAVGVLSVNGEKVKDYIITTEDVMFPDRSITNPAGETLIVRYPWESDREYEIEIRGARPPKKPLHGEKAPKVDWTIVASAKAAAPKAGGYPFARDGWPHYCAVVVEEKYGLARENEPIKSALVLYSDQIKSPRNELRIHEYDLATKTFVREVPFQVYDVGKWNETEVMEKDPDRYRATTTLSVIFPVSIKANESKIYFALYGNSEVKAPRYRTDLKAEVALKDRYYDVKIDNSKYEMLLHPRSGQLDSIMMKDGKEQRFVHHVETNGAIHWNPDCYSPPRPWVHVGDWDGPATQMETGPLMIRTARYGLMPHVPEIEASVTYEFYAGVPYMIAETVMQVNAPISVMALRNAEIVFNREVFDRFGWKDRQGKTHSVSTNIVPEGAALRVDADAPWVTFYSREAARGFAGVNLSHFNTNRFGGPAGHNNPYIYVNTGPWIYWSRALAYVVGTENRQQMITIPAGSIYCERWAYFLYEVGKDDSPAEFAGVEQLAERLKKPLAFSVSYEKDKSVPDDPPHELLVEEEDPYHHKTKGEWDK